MSAMISGKNRWFLSLGMIFMAGAFLAATAQASPLRNYWQFPELQDEVQVYYDQYGIPHIFAKNEHDLYWVQGFVQASDRLVEMDLVRRFALGRLSELVGSDTISDDIEGRKNGFNLVAERNLASLTPAELTLLENYAAGVNAYIDNMPPADLPPEYAILGILNPDLIVRWQPVHTMAILAYQAQGHTLDSGDDFGLERRLRHLYDRFGPPGGGDPRSGFGDDLMIFQPPRFEASVPYTAPTSRSFGPAEPMMPDFSKRPPVSDKVYDDLAQWNSRWYMRAFSPPGIGNSNGWAIRAEWTRDGFPMVAADPHLALQAPPIMYQVHLNLEHFGQQPLNLAGCIIPGVPGIVIGHNEYAGWALTNGQLDVQDSYLEEVVKDSEGNPGWVKFKGGLVPIGYRDEVIQYKDGAGFSNVTERIYEVPHHGYILSWDPDTNTAVSWKNSCYGRATHEFRAFTEIARARSVDDFFEALKYNVACGQGFVAADFNNNVLYYCKYDVPQRDPRGLTKDFPPYLPYPGDGNFEWVARPDGNVALTDPYKLPWVKNPFQGFVAAANADPTGTTFDNNPLPLDPYDLNDIYIGDVFDIGFRVGRIGDMVRNDDLDRPNAEMIDFNFVLKMQTDTKSALGMRMTQGILDAGTANPGGLANGAGMQEALDRLTAWDFRTHRGTEDATAADRNSSVATTIFNVWLHQFVPLAVADEMTAAGEGMFSGNGSTIGFRGFFRMYLQGGDYTGDAVWDNITTPEVETKDQISLQALQAALVWCETKFGTADQSQWLWGKIHTIRLEHFTGVGPFNIPPDGDRTYPNGFPWDGDQYAVAAAESGVTGNGYTSDDGPVYRIVTEFRPDGVRSMAALPGGQDGKVNRPHYDDEMEYWRKYKYHPFYFYWDETVQNSANYDVYSPDAQPPTPTPTETPLPDTPTPTPTETPVPGNPPVVLVAGYLNTHLTAVDGGTLVLLAVITDAVDKVYLAADGIPTDVEVPRTDPAGAYTFSVPLSGGLSPLRYPLQIVAVDHAQRKSDYWPYLTVH